MSRCDDLLIKLAPVCALKPKREWNIARTRLFWEMSRAFAVFCRLDFQSKARGTDRYQNHKLVILFLTISGGEFANDIRLRFGSELEPDARLTRCRERISHSNARPPTKLAHPSSFGIRHIFLLFRVWVRSVKIKMAFQSCKLRRLSSNEIRKTITSCR